jgi:hypothetical protein
MRNDSGDHWADMQVGQARGGKSHRKRLT